MVRGLHVLSTPVGCCPVHHSHRYSASGVCYRAVDAISFWLSLSLPLNLLHWIVSDFCLRQGAQGVTLSVRLSVGHKAVYKMLGQSQVSLSSL